MEIENSPVVGEKHTTTRDTFCPFAVLDGPFQMSNKEETKVMMRVTNFASDQKTVLNWCFIEAAVLVQVASKIKELGLLKGILEKKGIKLNA